MNTDQEAHATQSWPTTSLGSPWRKKGATQFSRSATERTRHQTRVPSELLRGVRSCSSDTICDGNMDTYRLSAALNLVFLGICAFVVIHAMAPASPVQHKPIAYAIGEHVSFQGLNVSSSVRTVAVYVTSDTVRSVRELLPKIMAVRGNNNRVQVVVLTNKAEGAASEMHNLGIEADRVVEVRAAQTKIRDIPTVLILDGSGTVRHMWRGEMVTRHEDEIIRAVADGH